MKFSNVKDVFMDFVKSGFRFGNTFSNYMAEKLEASPTATRIGGGVFDVAAGGGLLYMAATSMIGTVLGAVAAVSAVATAPIAALVTVCVGTLWLALSTMTAGIGLGLLDAARQKAGFARPSEYLRSTREAVDDATTSVNSVFKKGAKGPASTFTNAANGNKPAAQPEKKEQNIDFNFKK